MRGLRLSRVPKGEAFDLARLEGRMMEGVDPDNEEELVASLEPPWISSFCSYFSSLLPEILTRTWVIYHGDDLTLLSTPFGYLDDVDNEFQCPQVEELEEMVSFRSLPWSIVTGEYLVRVSNHLDGWDQVFFGYKKADFDHAEIAGKISDQGDSFAAQADIARSCDIAFACYEGIWGAFFRNERLLARTFFHCSTMDCFLYEIEEGVGPDGDWLTSCRKSCPVFHSIPRRSR